MKRIAMCLLIGLMSSTPPGVFKVLADLEVSASVQIRATADFHAPLAAHGAWIEVGRYGPCWRPTGVAVEWRPYGYGHWLWTDCGWYWVSDEPWAWACYHYGSWVYESDYGWIWVPGVEWGPAWVTWRIGGGYCGWAPLPPRGIVVVPRSFVFVEVGRFHEPVRPSTLIVNNTTIIHKTTELGSPKRETRNLGGAGPQKVVINEGPGLNAIAKATGKKLQPISIREAARQTPVPAEATRKMNESRKEQASAGGQDEKGSLKDRKTDRNEKPPPAGVNSPERGKEPPKTDVDPPPRRSPTSDAPSDKSSKSDKGKSGGKGHGKGKG